MCKGQMCYMPLHALHYSDFQCVHCNTVLACTGHSLYVGQSGFYSEEEDSHSLVCLIHQQKRCWVLTPNSLKIVFHKNVGENSTLSDEW